jgi:polyhydroxyalkanoate synthesis regulator phasin
MAPPDTSAQKAELEKTIKKMLDDIDNNFNLSRTKINEMRREVQKLTAQKNKL